MNTTDRWRILVHSFPELSKHLDARCEAKDVAAFAKSPAVTSGSLRAARFVLAVWSGGVKSARVWRVGDFDPVDAVGVWNHEHSTAFVAWCREPFWP